MDNVNHNNMYSYHSYFFLKIHHKKKEKNNFTNIYHFRAFQKGHKIFIFFIFVCSHLENWCALNFIINYLSFLTPISSLMAPYSHN